MKLLRYKRRHDSDRLLYRGLKAAVVAIVIVEAIGIAIAVAASQSIAAGAAVSLIPAFVVGYFALLAGVCCHLNPAPRQPCVHCNYELYGSGGAVCPECGTRIAS